VTVINQYKQFNLPIHRNMNRKETVKEAFNSGAIPSPIPVTATVLNSSATFDDVPAQSAMIYTVLSRQISPILHIVLSVMSIFLMTATRMSFLQFP